MKKFLSLLLAMTMVMSLIVLPARADDDATLTPSVPTTIEKGSSTTVQITAASGKTFKSGYPKWEIKGANSNVVGLSEDAGATSVTVTGKAVGTATIVCKYQYAEASTEGNTTSNQDVSGDQTKELSIAVNDSAGLKACIDQIKVGDRVVTPVNNTLYYYSNESNAAWTATLKSDGTYTGTATCTLNNNKLTVSHTQSEGSVSVSTTYDVAAATVSVTPSLSNKKVVVGGTLTLTASCTGEPSGAQYYWQVGDGTPSRVGKTFTVPTSEANSNLSVKCTVKTSSDESAAVVAEETVSGIQVIANTFVLKVEPSTTSLKTTTPTTVTAKLYDTTSNTVVTSDVSNYSMSVAGITSAFKTEYTNGSNTMTLTPKDSGTVYVSATATYMGKNYTSSPSTGTKYNATVTSSILSYTLPAIQSGSYGTYSNSELLNYANAIVGRPLRGFQSISASTQNDKNYLGTLTATSSGGYVQYTFSNVSASRKVGLAQFAATAYSDSTAYTIYFNVPVEPTGTTYPDQYPEPVASYGNTYRYYVQVPSGYYSYYVVGTPNQATRPTDWSQGSSSVYYATTTATTNLYPLTDANFVSGKCTLWIVTADSSGRLSCGQLTVYQKNHNINYNGVAGETVQFKHTDFTNFMNEVAQARGDSSKTGSYPYVTFSYVTFDYPSTAQGTLYYNGTAMSTSSYSGAFNSRTQITNLDNITFVPYAKTNAKTVAVTFTLHAVKYGTNGTVVNRDVQYRGTVNISLVREDVTFTVAPGDSVTFTDSDFLNYLRAQSGINYNYNIDYVTFDQSAVDTINGGVLYSGYAGFNAVKPTDKFYYTTTNNYTQNALSDVTFRASTYAKTGTTVYIPFTIYARYGTTGVGTRQVTGTVAVKIAQTMNFVDVKPTDYFYNPVKWAVGKNITKGTSAVTFSPDRTCTRAEIVTFLWRDAGSPMPTISRSPFSDVNYSMGADFYNAILWASQNGITAGTDVSHFSPNKTCTRAEIVTFLWRYAKKPVGYGSNSFTDVNKTDHAPYYDAILWAVSKGITNGSTTTTFAPDGTCTRGQAVTFLYRYEGGK